MREGLAGKDLQAGASSPWPHLPRNLGAWEAGGTIGTRRLGTGLGAEGHKGRVVIVLGAPRRAVRRNKVSRGSSAPTPPSPTPTPSPGSLHHPSLEFSLQDSVT